MRLHRAFPLILAALAASGPPAFAQSQPAPSSSAPLPAGLVRQGNVVMMQPVGESDERFPDTALEGERKTSLVRYLSPSDHDIYSRAFDAAARGDWTGAKGLASQGHDAIANKILEWRFLLDKNSGATFADITNFLKDNPDWPSRDALLARAEAAIDPQMDARATVAWFGDRKPVSAIGMVRLGEALSASGSAARGKEYIRRGWVEGIFDAPHELAIIQRDGAVLSPDVDRERITHLFLHGYLEDARREISRLGADDQRLANAAIALNGNPASGERQLANLPPASREDPIVVLEQTHLLRRQNAQSSIPALILRAPTHEMARINPTRWWNELNLDARDAFAAGNPRDAYALVSNTGLETGSNEYAESEFLAGWIALRLLKQPEVALTHFRTLAESVSRPISRSRARFWEGRAYEAEGNLAEAWRHYRLAADDPYTFYGQVALARIEAAARLHLPDNTADAGDLRATYDHEELTRAIHVAGDVGIENLLRTLALRDAEVYPDARHLKLLAEDVTAMGFREIAVRVAKQASYNGIHLPAYSHPVIAIPASTAAGAPEPALVLGIIRQETEFDPASVSGAGARGIMQVMPYSARHDAQLAGVDYRPQSLGSDPQYNMQLGMAELACYLTDWGGSYVLAAAAYNAGPGNVRKWIAAFGDPRDARVDPLDWIEEIPFTETRNYVQRVLDNTQVYRNRLSGHDERLRILEDVYRPNAVQTAPLSYVPPSQTVTAPVPMPKPAAPADDTGSPGDQATGTSRAGPVPPAR